MSLWTPKYPTVAMFVHQDGAYKAIFRSWFMPSGKNLELTIDKDSPVRRPRRNTFYKVDAFLKIAYDDHTVVMSVAVTGRAAHQLPPAAPKVAKLEVSKTKVSEEAERVFAAMFANPTGGRPQGRRPKVAKVVTGRFIGQTTGAANARLDGPNVISRLTPEMIAAANEQRRLAGLAVTRGVTQPLPNTRKKRLASAQK